MFSWMNLSRFGGRATFHRSALTAMGIVALLVAFGRSEPPAALADESPTVVRGREAISGAHPWMAALLEADEPDARRAQFCGATLVAPSWVLTAAHCVEADRGGFLSPSSVDVGLGLHDLSHDSGQRIGVRRVLAHSGYERDDGLDQDIALLELERPAVLGPRVATARLATAGDTPPIGASVTVTGWGETEGGRASRTLREATTHIVADGRCEAEPDVLCADGQVQDACFGDDWGRGLPFAESLTSRELEVLRLVARGLDNRAIADELDVSTKTVKSHVSNVLGKLGLADRTQAAVYALRQGIAPLGEDTPPSG